MFKFQQLKVWDKAATYSLLVMKIADNIPKQYQYSFGDQLRRAVLSITNNIAEGAGRSSLKESNYFFNVAKGSAYETINIIIMLQKAKIIDLPDNEKLILYHSAEEICKMLFGLMKKKKSYSSSKSLAEFSS